MSNKYVPKNVYLVFGVVMLAAALLAVKSSAGVFVGRTSGESEPQSVLGVNTSSATVTITSPAANSVISSNVDLSVRIVSLAEDIDYVEYWTCPMDELDCRGTSNYEMLSYTRNYPYTVNWDVSPLRNGNYRVTAVAIGADTDGPIGSGSIDVRLSRSLPVVKITKPVNSTRVNDNPSFEATVSNMRPGSIQSVTFAVCQLGTSNCSVGGDFINVGTDSTSPYMVTWNTTNFEPGKYKVRAEAAINNAPQFGYPWDIYSELKEIRFEKKKDTTPPVITITSPANNAVLGARATLSANVTDNVGVWIVEFSVCTLATRTCQNANEFGKVVIDRSSPYSGVWNTNSYPNGDYMLKVSAADGNSNKSEKVIRVRLSK